MKSKDIMERVSTFEDALIDEELSIRRVLYNIQHHFMDVVAEEEAEGHPDAIQRVKRLAKDYCKALAFLNEYKEGR